MDVSDYSLTTPRLRLLPLSEEDFADLDRLFADPDVTHFLGGGARRTPEELTTAWRDAVKHWADLGYGIWSVRDRQSMTFMGRCGLRFLADLGEVELLYTFEKAFWGQGYATEAATACARFAFERTRVNRLIAIAHPEHHRSRHVMEKLGMRLEKEEPFRNLPTVWYALTPLDFAARSPEAARG